MITEFPLPETRLEWTFDVESERIGEDRVVLRRP
jgi:hypothetical protein